MGHSAIRPRITIDFRHAAIPSRAWILGVDDDATDRLELIAFEGAAAARTAPGRDRPWMTVPRRPVLAALFAECSCPDFCERDHANE